MDVLRRLQLVFKIACVLNVVGMTDIVFNLSEFYFTPLSLSWVLSGD